MEQYIKVLKSYKRMTPELEECLRRNVYPMVLRKHDVINTAFYPDNQLYFVEKGLLLDFGYGPRGNQVIHSFKKENDFILSLYKLVKGMEGNYKLYEALEDSVVWVFSIEVVRHLLDNHPRFMDQYDVIWAKGMVQLNDSSHFRHLEPHLRYRYLRQESPDLLERVPKDLMASYIGVSEKVFGHLHRSRILLNLSVERRRRERRDQ